MTVLQSFTRPCHPVRAVQLTHFNTARVQQLLADAEVASDYHRPHGLLLHLPDGPRRLNYGQWLGISQAGRIDIFNEDEVAQWEATA